VSEDLVAPDVSRFDVSPDDEISDYFQLHALPVVNTNVNARIVEKKMLYLKNYFFVIIVLKVLFFK
jgi:hypothetical protein